MDQLNKLKQLADRMVAVVIAEGDPNTWAGAGKNLSEMSEAERGDRYWCKKNANQAITTAVKLETLVALYERRGSTPNGGKVDDVNDKVIKFEQAAKKRLEKLANG